MKDNDIDLNKLKNSEITKFAKKLAKTNTALWNAVCMAEGLAQDPIFKSFWRDEHEEFMKKLAHTFKKIKKNDESFVDVELHSRDFQDFDWFTSELEKYLETKELIK